MKTKFLLSLAAVVLMASSALADLSLTEYNVLPTNIDTSLNPTSGDEYLIQPGLAGPGGTFLAGGGGPSFINGATENTGGDVAGTGDVLSSDVLTNGAGGSFNLTLTMFSSNGSDLNPGGFTGGGLPLDTALIFIGANAGGDPIEFADHTVTLATLDLFDAGGTSLTGGPVDITAFGNFSAGPGGGWDGSLGVSFGAGSAGIGISSWVLSVDGVKAVPEPTSMALLSVLGLGLVTRRRR